MTKPQKAQAKGSMPQRSRAALHYETSTLCEAKESFDNDLLKHPSAGEHEGRQMKVVVTVATPHRALR